MRFIWPLRKKIDGSAGVFLAADERRWTELGVPIVVYLRPSAVYYLLFPTAFPTCRVAAFQSAWVHDRPGLEIRATVDSKACAAIRGWFQRGRLCHQSERFIFAIPIACCEKRRAVLSEFR